MTYSIVSRCRWCGGPLPDSEGPGRPRRYCRRSHRQRAYEARRLASAHALGPEDVLLSRSTYGAMRDLLIRIEAALQDVDTDLGAGADPERYRQALWHLYRVAADVRATGFEPKAVG